MLRGLTNNAPLAPLLGADPNVHAAEEGFTPLHRAVSGGALGYASPVLYARASHSARTLPTVLGRTRFTHGRLTQRTPNPYLGALDFLTSGMHAPPYLGALDLLTSGAHAPCVYAGALGCATLLLLAGADADAEPLPRSKARQVDPWCLVSGGWRAVHMAVQHEDALAAHLVRCHAPEAALASLTYFCAASLLSVCSLTSLL